jgi:hypothetical protein
MRAAGLRLVTTADLAGTARLFVGTVKD